MSGSTEALTAIIGISLVAAICDVLRGRIYNWLTLPALVLGLAWSSWNAGWPGLAQGLLGAALGLLAYGWLFWIGVMGGGDVKLLMALGAWTGPQYVAHVALLSILLGGLMAAILLLFKGRLIDLGARLYRFLLSVFVKELEVETIRIDRKHTMPFGIPIAAAAIWVAVANPLERWGLRLW